MSAVHVLPAPTTTSVTLSPEEATRRIEAVLDAVDASQVASASEAARAVAGLDRVLARAQSIRLKVLAAADRADVAADTGLTDTGAWLAGVSRTAGADAASQVRLASALDAGLQLTGAAMDAGEVSVEHAAIIAATTARLPGTLSDGQRDKVESVLVREAKRVDPARLRRAAKRALRLAELDAQAATAHLDAEQRSEEQQALDRTRLAIHDNRDGTMSGHFTVPALAGAILRKTIQQIASPRRHAARARAAGSQPDMGIDWGQRFGEAFVELLEHLPTDRLGGKVAATVVVTIDQQTLTDAVGVATLDTGHDLSAGEVRRIACGAGVLPAVLGGSSLPLDLGRTSRFFTEHQRVALATPYDECAADGCDRPYAWSELHHEDPWAAGGCQGPTDLALAVPLCGHHHRRVHDPTYDAAITTETTGRKSVSYHRRQ